MNEHKDDLADQVMPIIQRALEEDIGDGDVTTLCTVSSEKMVDGKLFAKEAGVIAGLEVARMTFLAVDERVEFLPQVADGDWVEVGRVIAELHGPGGALLTAERVALNFLQRMSGIATLTRRFVEAVEGTLNRYPGYAQDRPRPAASGQMGRAPGRRPEPPPGPIRHGAHQGQPHRRDGKHSRDSGPRAGVRYPSASYRG